MRVAVVDDEQEDIDLMVALLKRYQSETGKMFQIDTFLHAEILLENYSAFYDLIFLDVRMVGMDGFEVAERLRHLDQKVKIIFVTTLAQMAINGYQYDALDYFVKPVNYYDLKMRMDRIKFDTDKKHYVVVKYRNTTRVIELNDILYIESAGHQIIFHLVKETFQIRGKTLKSFEKELGKYGFAYCNSCYLLNLSHVKKVTREMAMVGDSEVVVSNAKYKGFLSEVIKYNTGDDSSMEG